MHRPRNGVVLHLEQAKGDAATSSVTEFLLLCADDLSTVRRWQLDAEGLHYVFDGLRVPEDLQAGVQPLLRGILKAQPAAHVVEASSETLVQAMRFLEQHGCVGCVESALAEGVSDASFEVKLDDLGKQNLRVCVCVGSARRSSSTHPSAGAST